MSCSSIIRGSAHIAGPSARCHRAGWSSTVQDEAQLWRRLMLPGLLGLAVLIAGCQPGGSVQDRPKLSARESSLAATLPFTPLSDLGEAAVSSSQSPDAASELPTTEVASTPPDPLSAARFAPEDQERFVIPVPRLG